MKRLLTLIIFVFLIFLPFTAGAATYYVCDTEADCDAGAAGNTDWETGSDSNNGTGRGTPWKTIQKAEDSMSAGDTVIVGDGTYTDSETLNSVVFINQSGTSGSWITYQAENKYGAVLDGVESREACFYLYGSNYIRIEGFEIKDSNVGIMVSHPSNATHDIVVYQCKIHGQGRHFTDTACVTNRAYCGITGNNKIYNITIDDCLFYDIGRQHRDPYCSHDYKHDHAIYAIGKHWVVRNSTVYNAHSGWVSKISGHEVSTSDPTHIFVNNTFAHDANDGPDANAHIIYYLDKGIDPHDSIFVNNVFYEPPGTTAIRTWVNLTDTVIKNNTTSAVSIYYKETGSGTPTTANNTTSLSLAGFRMTDPANYDFTLLSDSPLIDAGNYLTYVDYADSGSDSGTSIVVDRSTFFRGPISGDSNTVVAVTFYDATNDLQHRNVTAISGNTLTIDSSIDYIYDAANQTDNTKNTQISYEHGGVNPDGGDEQWLGPPQNEKPYCSVVNGDETIYHDVADTITAACTAIDPDGDDGNITYLWTFENGSPATSTSEDPGTVTFTCGAYPCSHTCSLVITDELEETKTYNFTITHIEVTPAVNPNSTTFLWGLDSNSDTLGPCDYSVSDTVGDDAGHVVVYDSGTKKLGTYALKIDGSGSGDTYISFADDAEDIWGGASITDFSGGFWFKSIDWVNSTYIIYALEDADNQIRIITAGDDEIQVHYEESTNVDTWITSGCSLNDGNWWYIMPYADSVSNVQGIRVYNEAGTLQGCSNTTETDTLTAITISAAWRFHIGQAVSGAGDYYLDAIRLSTDFEDNFVTDGTYLDDCTQELSSIGSTDQDGTYGIDDYLAVPFVFDAPTTLNDGVNATIESYATCETDVNDLKLAFSVADTALTTHWLTTTSTAGYKIIADMTSADLTVTSITIGGDDTIDSSITIPAGENLNDNAAVIIDGTATSLSIATIALCDSDGVALAENTTNSSVGTVYASITLAGSELGFFSEGPILDLEIAVSLSNGTLSLTYAGTQPSGWGVGYNEWLFEGALEAGDRDDGSECVLSGSAMTRTIGTKIIDGGNNELSDYDWPDTDILSGFTWRVIVAGTVSFGTGKDFTTLVGFIQVDGDRLDIHDDTMSAESYDITASDVTLSGIGRKRLLDALTFTGDDNHVRCVMFSGGVTDNGAGNTYHPICSKGADRLGMNLN